MGASINERRGKVIKLSTYALQRWIWQAVKAKRGAVGVNDDIQFYPYARSYPFFFECFFCEKINKAS